jgi:tetratricopeptide (TPR) repeat protein
MSESIKTPPAIELLNCGKAKVVLKDYVGALKDFDKAIELYPFYVDAYALRGRVKSKLEIQKERSRTGERSRFWRRCWDMFKKGLIILYTVIPHFFESLSLYQRHHFLSGSLSIQNDFFHNKNITRL